MYLHIKLTSQLTTFLFIAGMTNNMSLNMGCLSFHIENQVGVGFLSLHMKNQVGLMSQRVVMRVTVKVKAFHGAI